MQLFQIIQHSLPGDYQPDWQRWVKANSDELQELLRIDDSLPGYWRHKIDCSQIRSRLRLELAELKGIGKVRSGVIAFSLITWPDHLYKILHSPEELLTWRGLDTWFDKAVRDPYAVCDPSCRYDRKSLRTLRQWVHQRIDISEFAKHYSVHAT
jgi:hypothetical protein